MQSSHCSLTCKHYTDVLGKCASPHALAERSRWCVSCWHEYTLKWVHWATYSLTSYDQKSLWNTGLSSCNGVEKTVKCPAWRPVIEKHTDFNWALSHQNISKKEVLYFLDYFFVILCFSYLIDKNVVWPKKVCVIL